MLTPYLVQPGQYHADFYFMVYSRIKYLFCLVCTRVRYLNKLKFTSTRCVYRARLQIDIHLHQILHGSVHFTPT